MFKYTSFYVFLFSFFVFSCQNKEKYIKNEGEIFHTYYHIQYEYKQSLSKEIQAKLEEIDASLNPFKENSIIAKVNNNEEVSLDSFFIEVFSKSMEISKITDGYFDITAAPMINAWGFGFKNKEEINEKLIDSLKEIVSYEKIYLQDKKIYKKDKRISLNMSAIAKGYACDVIARLFDSLQIKNYMCEIGGEIRVKGLNPKGQCWTVGISSPIEDSLGVYTDIYTKISLCDKSIATSGNYRNFYIKDGKKYAHTINPKTAYPSEENILSATIIAEDCMTADAYATACMVLGLEKSIETLKSVGKIDYSFIYVDSLNLIKTIYSENFPLNY